METLQIKKVIMDFLTELHQDATFNDELWNRIRNYFKSELNIWIEQEKVPKGMFPYIMDLVSQLSGGNRFADEVTSEKMENAEMELLEMFYNLYDKEDRELYE